MEKETWWQLHFILFRQNKNRILSKLNWNEMAAIVGK